MRIKYEDEFLLYYKRAKKERYSNSNSKAVYVGSSPAGFKYLISIFLCVIYIVENKGE